VRERIRWWRKTTRLMCASLDAERSREEGMSVRKENLETSDEAIGAMCETEGMSEETIEGMIRGTSGAMRDDPTTDVTSGETIGTIAGVVSGMCELLRVTPGACET
jgi:hypothetical protein